MKLFAYISIFLIVHSNVIFAGERAARALRGAVRLPITPSNPTVPKKPEETPRGKQWNPSVKAPEANPVINFSGQETPINEGKTTNPESSGSLSPTELRPGGSGGSAGLGLQLKNLSSALPINSPSTSPSKDGDLERKLPGSPNGGNSSGGSSEGQPFGKWWPVCVLVDGPDANAQITEMVAMSAACGVNLQPYVRVVTGFNPEDEASINSLQRSTCNIKESGIADKGSTLVLTNRSSTVADKMCGITQDRKDSKKPSTDVAGCNELANGASAKSKERAESTKSEGDGFGSVASGSVAVGIVDREGYNSGKIYSHETMGHGQMGLPNGKKAGNGIGDPDDKDDNSGEGDPGAYTEWGCQQMRASAIPDPQKHHRYFADRKTYYSHESMSKKPMQLGEPIWKTFKDGPQTPDVAQKNPTAPPRGNDQNSSPPGSPSGTPLATAGPGHKKPLGQVSRDTKIRSGDANTVSGRVAQRGGDSPDAAGSAVDGKGTGEAFGNKTIVANQAAPSPDGNNLKYEPNSSGPNSFASSSGDSSSGSGGEMNTKGYSSSYAESAAGNLKLNPKQGGDNPLDPDYLNGKFSPETNEQISRKPRRSEPVNELAGTSANRIPASPSKGPTAQTRKTNKPQVTFGGGV